MGCYDLHWVLLLPHTNHTPKLSMHLNDTQKLEWWTLDHEHMLKLTNRNLKEPKTWVEGATMALWKPHVNLP